MVFRSNVICFFFFFPAVLGRSCSTRDLSLGRVGSVVAARGLICPAACGILVPDQGSNPRLSPALEGRLLTTGPPGKSLIYIYMILFIKTCLYFIKKKCYFINKESKTQCVKWLTFTNTGSLFSSVKSLIWN